MITFCIDKELQSKVFAKTPGEKLEAEETLDQQPMSELEFTSYALVGLRNFYQQKP